MNRFLGIDVGGANLKYADNHGFAVDRGFAMWRDWKSLADVISKDLRRVGHCDALAVTMTGELADCFRSRLEGVTHIVEQVQRAAAGCGVTTVAYYGTDGDFRDSQGACDRADLVAAANWHALGRYVAEQIAANALLIDIGSTTTDLIRLVGGQVATTARTDFARLADRSLVYIGCRRTPVCGLVDELRFRGRSIPVMNELFATIDDAQLVLGLAGEADQDMDTADSRPRTRANAIRRLARMLGLDGTELQPNEAWELASQVVSAARARLDAAVQRQTIPNSMVVLSGHGDDMLTFPSGTRVLSLTKILGQAVSRCGPSYSVAKLYEAACNPSTES